MDRHLSKEFGEKPKATPTIITDSDQNGYWNALSKEYHKITKISCNDFHYGPQIPGENALRLLPKFKHGDTSLELGCGGAQNSIWLAKQGLICMAVDISEEQLGHAKNLAAKHKVNIVLEKASLNDFSNVIKGREFNFVHSSHALEFVQKPESVVQKMAECVSPGGLLMISTVHPLYNGEWMDVEVENAKGEIIESSGQFVANYFSPPDDIRNDNGEFGVSRAYPLSKWFKWIKQAGLNIIAMEEPMMTKYAPYTSKDWAEQDGFLDSIPATIIFVAQKPV